MCNKSCEQYGCNCGRFFYEKKQLTTTYREKIVKEKDNTIYPCVKIFHDNQVGDQVILWFSKKKAIILYDGGENLETFCINNYDDEGFVPFHGSITINVQ